MSLPPVICHSCGSTYNHPGRAGKTKCQKCGTVLTVTLPDSGTPAPPAAPSPAPPKRPAQPVMVRGSGSATIPAGGAASRASVRRQGPNPAIMWGSLGGVVVIVVVILLVVSGGSDDPAGGPGKDRTRAERNSRADDGRSDSSTLDTDEETEPDVTIGGTDPMLEEPPDTEVSTVPVKKKPKPKPKPKPRFDVEKYSSLQTLDRFAGCSPEDAAKITKLVAAAQDDVNPRDANRARYALVDDHGKNAIPHVINGFLELDLQSVERTTLIRGNILNEILQDITRTRRGFDDRSETDEGIKSRVICRYRWWKWWKDKGVTWEPPKDE